MEKHPATVCYFGLVDNHSGEWIGIEWWNQQGKHNGTFNGKFYFKTKNPLNGSFIRRQRISFENSFAQAIQKQYIKSFSNKNITPDISYSARYFIACAERQRHNRSDSELKQQHEILLSTLLLEQQLHSTATDEHKRRVNEETLLKLYDEIRPNLILVTGGTRISLHDITPE
ncbi:unnamed protein product, partial [Rotaria magnacalcarata]